MDRPVGIVLYVLAVIVGLDVLFLKEHLWARLLVNIGVVVLFGGVYVGLLRKA